MCCRFSWTLPQTQNKGAHVKIYYWLPFQFNTANNWAKTKQFPDSSKWSIHLPSTPYYLWYLICYKSLQGIFHPFPHEQQCSVPQCPEIFEGGVSMQVEVVLYYPSGGLGELAMVFGRSSLHALHAFTQQMSDKHILMASKRMSILRRRTAPKKL